MAVWVQVFAMGRLGSSGNSPQAIALRPTALFRAGLSCRWCSNPSRKNCGTMIGFLKARFFRKAKFGVENSQTDDCP